MEILNKVNLQATVTDLACLTDEELSAKIEDSVGMVIDELKGWVESITCSTLPNTGTMMSSARLDYAIGNLKFLSWEKFQRNRKKLSDFKRHIK